MTGFNSYTLTGTKIQSMRLVAVAIAGLVCACSPISMPIGSADVETPLVLTGSIPSALEIAYSDIDTTDRRVIAAALSAALGQAKEQKDLSWSNPESGNSGTISKVETSSLEDTGCLGFQTTANTIDGVRLYNGTACRDISRAIAITALTVAKS